MDNFDDLTALYVIYDLGVLDPFTSFETYLLTVVNVIPS